MRAELYFADAKTPANVNLISYLKQNLEVLIRNGLHFDFIVVAKNQFNDFKKKDMTHFPILKVGDEKREGHNDILYYFKLSLKKSQKKQKSSTDLDNYMTSTLTEGMRVRGNGKNRVVSFEDPPDDDDPDVRKREIDAKVSREAKRRQLGGEDTEGDRRDNVSVSNDEDAMMMSKLGLGAENGNVQELPPTM